MVLFLELSYSNYLLLGSLPIGATACVKLKRFEEAITWCDKGLAVSFEGILNFLTVGIMEIFHNLTF